MLKNIWILMFVFVCGLYAQSTAKFKVGTGLLVGFGGVAGVGAEFEMEQMAILAGGGTFDGVVGFEIGGRYYFRPVDRKLRPHGTISYAPTHEIKYGNLSNLDHKALIYGFNFMAGLDHDFGKPGGFIMTYGLGLAVPGSLPQRVQDFYNAAHQPLPKTDIAPTGALGIKYQF